MSTTQASRPLTPASGLAGDTAWQRWVLLRWCGGRGRHAHERLAGRRGGRLGGRGGRQPLGTRDDQRSAGQGLHVDNTDRIRHTFAVEGTDVLAELPAGSARRVALDLDPGAYRLLCTVPGLEAMTAALTVTP